MTVGLAERRRAGLFMVGIGGLIAAGVLLSLPMVALPAGVVCLLLSFAESSDTFAHRLRALLVVAIGIAGGALLAMLTRNRPPLFWATMVVGDLIAARGALIGGLPGSGVARCRHRFCGWRRPAAADLDACGFHRWRPHGA